MKELGNFFKHYVQSGCNPHFVIEELQRGWISELAVSSDVIDRMIRQRHFGMGKIVVHLSNKLATTKISLCLDGVEKYTVSRFPRSLLQDDLYKEGQ